MNQQYRGGGFGRKLSGLRQVGLSTVDLGAVFGRLAIRVSAAASAAAVGLDRLVVTIAVFLPRWVGKDPVAKGADLWLFSWKTALDGTPLPTTAKCAGYVPVHHCPACRVDPSLAEDRRLQPLSRELHCSVCGREWSHLDFALDQAASFFPTNTRVGPLDIVEGSQDALDVRSLYKLMQEPGKALVRHPVLPDGQLARAPEGSALPIAALREIVGWFHSRRGQEWAAQHELADKVDKTLTAKETSEADIRAWLLSLGDARGLVAQTALERLILVENGVQYWPQGWVQQELPATYKAWDLRQVPVGQWQVMDANFTVPHDVKGWVIRWDAGTFGSLVLRDHPGRFTQNRRGGQDLRRGNGQGGQRQDQRRGNGQRQERRSNQPNSQRPAQIVMVAPPAAPAPQPQPPVVEHLVATMVEPVMPPAAVDGRPPAQIVEPVAAQIVEPVITEPVVIPGSAGMGEQVFPANLVVADAETAPATRNVAG